VGVNILEDARHSSVLYICKSFVHKVADDAVQYEGSLPDYVAPTRAYEATYNHTCRNSVFGPAASPVSSHTR
jgi:hypothetical protein